MSTNILDRISTNLMQDVTTTITSISAAIQTASQIAKQAQSRPHECKASYLTKMVTMILSADEPSQLKQVLKMQLVKIGTLTATSFPEEKKQLNDISTKIQTTLKRLELELNDKPVAALRFSAKDKPVAVRIQEHNLKATQAQKFLESADETFDSYPVSAEDKEKFRAQRTMVSSMKDFVGSDDPLAPPQILSETVPLQKCSVNVACAKGNRKDMEDGYTVASFAFKANDVDFEAEIFGVFDGHGGKEVEELVQSTLVSKVKTQLEGRLSKKDPNETDIFYALKDAVEDLDKEARLKKCKGGTTATFGFRLCGSTDLWTANIGDSRAFLNRGGKLIPMSIDQKPYLIQNPLALNEYANQLLNKGVEISQCTHEELKEVAAGKKMVTSFIYDMGNRYDMRLGIYEMRDLDMTRSIGDEMFAPWKKATPEIFRRKIIKGDQLILHTDGIDAGMNGVVNAVETDKKNGCTTRETVECLVQASIPAGDNVTAMIVSF